MLHSNAHLHKGLSGGLGGGGARNKKKAEGGIETGETNGGKLRSRRAHKSTINNRKGQSCRGTRKGNDIQLW